MKFGLSSKQHAQRSQAMVIALMLIALLSILVIGFLLRTTANLSAASSYLNMADTRRLADVAVNLVQAQISDATLQGSGYIWASQPGAIRVFNPSGTLDTIYRLYSAASLTTNNAAALTNDVAADWTNYPALYTDLNAPVQTVDSSGATNTFFPILDPRNPTDPSTLLNVDGFGITNAPGAQDDPTQPNYQPAPMPVEWLYVLQNGQIVAPTAGGTGSTVTVAGATTANPIVGRIAFWTDDDTCKVNINTAGGDGANNLLANTTTNTATMTFWDTPHFSSPDDIKFDTYSPAAGEYQRFSGHPATTALNMIFNDLGITFPAPASSNFYNVLPRYNYGGSEGGAVPIYNSTAIAAKTNAFYSSVGELMFQRPSPGSTARTPTGITRQQVETGKFFLTAHSRAPEVNLFGLPRVSIWPVSAYYPANNNFYTPTDALMAFDSTIGTNAFYFTREDPTNGATDINLPNNVALMQYLDTLTSQAIPGYGGNFDTKYPSSSNAGYSLSERRQILTEIFDYIRLVNLDDSTVAHPYAAPSPTNNSDYASEGQISPAYDSTWGTQGFGRFYRIAEPSIQFVAMGAGTNTTVTPSINAVPIQSWYLKNGAPNYTVSLQNIPRTTGTPPNNTTAIMAFFVFSVFDPALGFSDINPDVTYDVSGLDSLSVTSGSAGSYTGPYNLGFLPEGYYTDPTMGGGGTTGFSGQWSGSQLGGYFDIRCNTIDHLLSPTIQGDVEVGSFFPFYSAITAVNTASTLTFSGGTITVKVYGAGGSPYGSPPVPGAVPIQTYNFSFPQTTIPMPKLIGATDPILDAPLIGSGGYITDTNNNVNWDRWNNINTNGAPSGSSIPNSYTLIANYIQSNDVVRSLFPNSGDIRITALTNVPASAFAPYANYTGSATNLAHAQWCSAYGPGAPPFTGAQRGSLVDGVSYPTNLPFVATGVNGVLTHNGAPGDWDNGIADYPDGPYINKPDEGNNAGSGEGNVYYTSGGTNADLGTNHFSPNREIASPVMFGSLSTGVAHQYPWQTLLFRPGPGSAGGTAHPGEAGYLVDGTASSGAPPDHLLLDLFWMPVPQPYAISEPFSTEGKVNLNYQIVPFTYISRSTAMNAVLAGEEITRVPSSQVNSYKLYTTAGVPGMSADARLPIDIDQTLSQFTTMFTTNLFRSADQICDVYLVPQGYTWPSFASTAAGTGWYGSDFALVGDNERERPYSDIYSRVTTKSNTYTVHFTVQTLKNTSSDPTQWTEGSGVILGVYRGSTTLERYLDPTDTNLTSIDFATDTTTNVDYFYKWRVLESDQFAP